MRLSHLTMLGPPEKETSPIELSLRFRSRDDVVPLPQPPFSVTHNPFSFFPKDAASRSTKRKPPLYTPDSFVKKESLPSPSSSLFLRAPVGSSDLGLPTLEGSFFQGGLPNRGPVGPYVFQLSYHEIDCCLSTPPRLSFPKCREICSNPPAPIF